MAYLYPVTPPIKLYTDSNGNPLEGGYVYFGTANQNPETNPIQMYWDSTGLIPAAQPIRTVNGYLVRAGTPANIFASGDFSITIRDSNGVLIFTHPTSTDLQLALSIAGGTLAASIPIADAGGYYTTDNVEAALQQIGGPAFVGLTRLGTDVTPFLAPTGALIDYIGLTAPTGWVLASGNTIGNAASGATERANADTITLYTLLWNSYANAELPIQDSAGNPTTRGAGASNDFAANKRLPVPDCRGRTRLGKDNMGGSTASRVTVAGGNFDATVMGRAGGAQNHTLSTAELAAHTHTGPSHSHTIAHTHAGPSHSHTIAHTHKWGASTSDMGGGAGSRVTSGSTSWDTGASSAASSGNDGTGNTGPSSAANSGSDGTGASGSAGTGTAHTVLSPAIVSTVIIKL